MGEGEGEDGGRAQRGKRRRGRGGEDPAKHQATLRKGDEARERDGGGRKEEGGRPDSPAKRQARQGKGTKGGGGGTKARRRGKQT